jgi:transposase-like protein
MVLELCESGAKGATVSKRHRVNQSMLWRWCKQFKVNPKEFSLIAAARVIDTPGAWSARAGSRRGSVESAA